MKSARPVVSVIIPTYNRASTVGTAIDSALSQTYSPLEVVVVDDGSTDDTQRLLEAYASDIVGVRQDNKGVAAARNTGIRRSSGSIVMFLDSDDRWIPEAVAARVDVLEAAGSDIPCSICDLSMIRGDGDEVSMFMDRRLRPRHPEGIWTNVQEVLATRFLFTNQTLAVRRGALEEVGLFDESLWVMEDFDLAMRLSALGPWAYTTQILATWREGSPNSLGAMATTETKRLNETVIAICRKLRAAGILESRLARSGITYMERKATRRLALSDPSRRSSRAFLKTQAFIEEEVVERLYRNSWLYPRIESEAP